MLARWFTTGPPLLAPSTETAAVETILIVEDEPDVAESMASVVVASGPHRVVETVRSAEEALDLLRGRPYSFIIADYRLHGMDGVTFLRRALDLAPDLRAILTSASPERAREAALAAGLPPRIPLLAKPFGAADLTRWIAA